MMDKKKKKCTGMGVKVFNREYKNRQLINQHTAKINIVILISEKQINSYYFRNNSLKHF